MEGQQWTTVTNRTSKGKAKASPCNVVCTSFWKAKIDVPSLTDSEEETIILAAEQEPNVPLVAETHSGQSYLKKYAKFVANPPRPTLEPTKPSRSNLQRSRRSFGTPEPSRRTKQKEL